MGIARAVVRQADAALPRLQGRREATPLSATVDLVRQVVAQTRARVLRGDTHYPDKVVSLFEPHTEILRKGKLAKPTEFGRLVKIQETEAQFISDYEVCAKRTGERALWAPARWIATLPSSAARRSWPSPMGFASRANERAAQDRGVRQVVLPRQAHETRSRRARAALRWRTGKRRPDQRPQRRHGLRRCRYRGENGMERWIGFGIIANNLLVFGRAAP